MTGSSFSVAAEMAFGNSADALARTLLGVGNEQVACPPAGMTCRPNSRVISCQPSSPSLLVQTILSLEMMGHFSTRLFHVRSLLKWHWWPGQPGALPGVILLPPEESGPWPAGEAFKLAEAAA